MTDKEMIKAIECCLKSPVDCDNCAYTKYPVRDCNTILKNDIADLINRQQQEIERLKNDIFCISNEKEAYANIVDTTAAEAIKEFARKLKCGVSITSGIITSEDVDNLVKEMVGADNGN